MNELKIIDKVKWLINYCDAYIFSSFPKIHMALKIKVEGQLYSLIENIIRANINKGNIRRKYQNDCICNIYLLDFYIGIIYDRKIIKKIRRDAFINSLVIIRKMCYGWVNSEKL